MQVASAHPRAGSGRPRYRGARSVDAKNEVLIEPGVVTLGRDGPVGVAVAVETTTGYDKLSMIKRVIGFYKTTVGAGKDHRWTAKGNVSQQATVIVKKGYGTVKATKPPFQNVKVRRAKYTQPGQ